MGEIIVAVFGIYLVLQMIIGYRRGLICPKIKIGGEIPLYPFMYLNISWNGIIAPDSSVAVCTNNFLTVSVGYKF